MDYQLASLGDAAADHVTVADLTTQASWAIKIGMTYLRLGPAKRTAAGVSLIATPSALIAGAALHASRQHRAGNVALLVALGAAIAGAAIILPAWRT